MFGARVQLSMHSDQRGHLVLGRLLRLRAGCIALEREHAAALAEVEAASRRAGAGEGPGEAVASARNLIHYLALRREDVRELQTPLAELGLSSLGRIESHVLANLTAVISTLRQLGFASPDPPGGEGEHGRPAEDDAAPPIVLSAARALLERRARLLLGPAGAGGAGGPGGPGVARDQGDQGDEGGEGGEGGGVRIMVTLPTEAATDPALVRSLLDAGMTCARINTAHDGPAEWSEMCRHVREESARRQPGGGGGGGAGCRILMDLAGLKLRTGPIEPGPEVVRIKPVRDPLGRVLRRGELELHPAGGVGGAELRAGGGGGVGPGRAGLAGAPVDGEWLAGLRVGDAIELVDTRGRRRVLKVGAVRDGEDGGRGKEGKGGAGWGGRRVLVRSDRTVYVGTGTVLRLIKADGRLAEATIGRLAPVAQAITVRPGDRVVLSLAAGMGRPAGEEGGRGEARPAVLTCTLPEAFARARVGDPVWFDDGRVGAEIEAVGRDAIDLRITTAQEGGDRIRPDKGINLPETEIALNGLTSDDLSVLPLAAANADMVGMSFVREGAEVLELRRRLDELGGGGVGVVLKIETRRAFENLPGLLLAALQGPSAGVMIARGDLAVEVGYERLAEVQEEILWLCEAAHVPVIWATQVLETMAKTGRPSRAEVTDAAMGERAECVMLNKGPHIVAAVRFLANLVRRMQEHQSKKRTMLRSLSVARRFGTPVGDEIPPAPPAGPIRPGGPEG